MISDGNERHLLEGSWGGGACGGSCVRIERLGNATSPPTRPINTRVGFQGPGGEEGPAPPPAGAEGRRGRRQRWPTAKSWTRHVQTTMPAHALMNHTCILVLGPGRGIPPAACDGPVATMDRSPESRGPQIWRRRRHCHRLPIVRQQRRAQRSRGDRAQELSGVGGDSSPSNSAEEDRKSEREGLPGSRS